MKKLAIIGATAVAIAASFAMAQTAMASPVDIAPAGVRAVPNPYAHTTAVPAGFTQDEYQALVLRSKGLNQKYGTAEFGAKGAGTSQFDNRPLVLDLIHGVPIPGSQAGGTPSVTPTSTESSGVQWDTVGISIAALLGFAALVATAIVGVRHRGHLRTS